MFLASTYEAEQVTDTVLCAYLISYKIMSSSSIHIAAGPFLWLSYVPLCIPYFLIPFICCWTQ